MGIDILKTMNRKPIKNEIQHAQCPAHGPTVPKEMALRIHPGYPNTAASLLHPVHHINIRIV